MRVLLIEDDLMIGRGLVRALGDADMKVDWVRDAPSGTASWANGNYGLVLLDLGLPGGDGLDLLQKARNQGIDFPVIVVTARDDLDSRVHALDVGADDCLLKPFEGRELLARIRAVIRRHAGRNASLIEVGPLMLDLATHEVTCEGVSAVLPPKEFALIHALARQPGTILSRSQLQERLYGPDEDVESNAIDVLIHYIRKRFGKGVIQNVRGAGWLVLKDG